MTTKVAGRRSHADKPDADKDRQSAWRLAWMTTAAAVVGSLVTSVVTVVVVANRDDDRSHQEFLRAERAELYTQYVAAVDESRLLMEPFLRPGVLDIGAHFESLEIYAAPQSRETIAAIEEANRQVATVTAQIAVMGGGAATSAEQLKEDLEGTHRAIEMVYDCETYTPGSWICDEYMSDPLLDRSLTRFLSDREEFLAATRTQLATVD